MSSDYSSIEKLSDDLGKRFKVSRLKNGYVQFFRNHDFLGTFIPAVAICSIIFGCIFGMLLLYYSGMNSEDRFSTLVVFMVNAIAFLFSVLFPFVPVVFDYVRGRVRAQRFVEKNPWVLDYVEYYDTLSDSNYGERYEVEGNYRLAYEKRCAMLQKINAVHEVAKSNYRKAVHATDALDDLTDVEIMSDADVCKAFDRDLES